MPSVSVIIPVFGVEPYIARCVRSLFGQTLQDMEFIFIDDCSPDKSIDIMRDVLEKEFPERIPQVRVFRMPHNSGQAKVRMQGISMATGEYVIHCDSDDKVEVNAYEQMYLLARKEDADVVTCDYKRGNDNEWAEYCQESVYGQDVSDILTGKVMGSLWCRLVRRELYDNLIPPVGNMTEDVVITIQILCKAKSISHLHFHAYYYYDRQDSIMRSPGMEAALARWKSVHDNTQLCVDILRSRMGFRGGEFAIIDFKYRTRAYLIPYIHRRGVYRLWKSTFPEIDRHFLFTKEIALDTKFWYVLIRLHLYHPWKVVSRGVRRFICSRASL